LDVGLVERLRFDVVRKLARRLKTAKNPPSAEGGWVKNPPTFFGNLAIRLC
jgi:hypothetical protein